MDLTTTPDACASAFRSSAGESDEAELTEPGVAGLHSILESHFPEMEAESKHVEEALNDLGLEEDASFLLDDFKVLVARISVLIASHKNTESNDKAASGLSTLVDKIERRRCLKEELLLDVTDVNCKQAEENAIATVALVDKTDYDELKTYIEKKMHEQLSNMPVLASGPQKNLEALTLRENYYGWMREFVVVKSFESGVLAHRMSDDLFIALITPCSQSEPELKAAAADAVQGMKARFLVSFNDALWTAWEQNYPDEVPTTVLICD
jgi:hypothetical protein